MPRRFRRGGSRRPARGMDWDVAQLSVTLQAQLPATRTTTTSGYVVLPSDVRARYVDPTLMATRTFITNILRFTLGGTGSTNEVQFFGAGLIMWSDVNDTAPTGADCPDPLRDGDLDWVNRWVFTYAPLANAGSLANSNIFDNTHLSKAKRRFGQDQGLLLAFSGTSNDAAVLGTATFMADVRALIKE